jgi:hypothetical protein
MAVNEVWKLNGPVEGEKIYFEVEVPICGKLNVLDSRRLVWDLKEEWLAWRLRRQESGTLERSVLIREVRRLS